MGVLDKILETKRRELEALRKLALPTPPPLRPVGLRRGTGEPLKFLTEIKFRSPSAGPLSTTLSVGERALAYEQGGATMLSVLCDRSYFDGSFEHLALARAACSLPLLCKEFVIDEIQLEAARAFGADAVLLIVRCLSEARLLALVNAATALGLTPLVEISTEQEAELAVRSGAELVGVNARDLDTLQMDAARAQRILAALPPDRVRIHLSGVTSEEAVASLAEGPADAVLIGEVLMREAYPTPLLRRLVSAAGGHRSPQQD